MDCKQIIDLISMYVDSELDERQKAEFEEHVSQCSSCKEELNDILKVLEVLHSIPEVDLPDNFKDELHEKLIKVKENEFSTGKLFFIKNRYIRAISTVAAGVLIIFVLKGILFDGFLL
jgi:anti-sigma factor RsiW